MEKENNETALKEDFLAACQSIIFSRTSEDDRHVERRRLAVKYLTASQFESEETVALLLSQGLKQYETLMEKADVLKEFPPIENKDRSKWRSSLKDPKVALSMVKPLPCQSISSDKVCGRRDPVDRDVENLMKLGEQKSKEESSVGRKIPVARALSYQKLEPESRRPRYDRYTDSQHADYSKNREVRGEEASGRFGKRPVSRADVERRPQSRWVSDKAGPSWGDESLGRPQGNRWEKMENEEKRNREEEASGSGAFRTAKAELKIQQQKVAKKTLGGKGSVNSRFVCPLKREKDHEDEKSPLNGTPKESSEEEDERLKGIDQKLIELVRNEIMDSGAYVSWDDVAGLEHAKKIIREIIVLPMLRPDIFTGLRRPPKGILLFGPPGTGKTLIGKCIASQSKSTFFSISASSLTSKWIGEGEKMVRALFAVARVHQPSVIFIDEIDSLLTQRSETEHESSRRIKTEFLVQLDGATTGDEDRILVVGATNRPQELDEAARRRFVKRLYVPLPEMDARRQIIVNLLSAIPHMLTQRDIDRIAQSSEHYSGADMTNLCKEASMGPIRSIPFHMLENIRKEDVRPVTADDFDEALTNVRPSVSNSDLGLYVNWDRTYGSGTAASLAKSKSRD